MRLSHEDYVICKQQKRLYEYICTKGYDVKEFSSIYLKSDFCNRSIDAVYSAKQYMDIVNWIEFLEIELGENFYVPAKKFTRYEVAGWIGFTYRQLQIETGLHSRELEEKVPFDRLVIAYPGFHTIDEDMAAEILIKNFSLDSKK